MATSTATAARPGAGVRRDAGALAGLAVSADLDFSVTPPGSDEPVEGHLRGSGSELELFVSSLGAFGTGGGRGLAAAFADELARQDVTVHLVGPSGRVATMGPRVGSWWQRRVTGSRHIRIVRGGGLWRLLRAQAYRGQPVLPRGELAPPPTPYPLVPTVMRRPRPPVTTTHDPAGGGQPRLVAIPARWTYEQPRRVYPLRPGVTSIGSDPSCDIRVPGLAAIHAEVRRDDQDEYVVVGLASDPPLRVNGAPVRQGLLRTGTRVEIGESTFTYNREEYADHGRPYGGRIGGELGHQQPQPSYRELQEAFLRSKEKSSNGNR